MSTRRLLWSLAAALLFVTACGGDSDEGSEPAAAASSETAAEGSDTEATEGDSASEADGEDAAPLEASGPITFWHSVPGAGGEMVDDAIARFEADTGVQVDAQFFEPDSYKTQIRIALGAGNEPCAFFSWGGGVMNSYVDAGQIIELGSRLESSGEVERLVPSSLTHVTYQDQIWGVPAINTSPAVFFYNTEIFADLGLEPPATWTELLAVMDTLSEAGIAPLSLANFSKWPSSFYFMYFVDRLAGPGTFEAAANRTGGSFADPVFVRAGELIQELVDRGAFVDGFNGIDFATGGDRQVLYADVAAMELMGSWHISLVKDENPEYLDKMGVFAFPDLEEGTGDPTNVVGSVGQNFFHVSSSRDSPDAAYELITYLFDDTSVAASVEQGRIPPIRGVGDLLEDPLQQEVFGLVEGAGSIQLWYDQYLRPNLAEVHLDLVQELFAGTISPEEAAQRMEETAASSSDESE